MSKAMHLSLRAGERVYINGAVLRVDRKVSIELLNDATFLLETHVLHADEATTPLRQLYFAVQTILIEPGEATRARDLFRSLRTGILGAVTETDIRQGVAAADALVEADRLIEALKLIRGLYRAEAAIMVPATVEATGTAATGTAATGTAATGTPSAKTPAPARRARRAAPELHDRPA